MMRKFRSFILVLALMTTGLVFSNQVEASELDNSTIQAAPNTVYVDNLLYFGQQDYIFYTLQRHGAYYRGYVGKYATSGDYGLYRGTLYKDPLPYPMP